MAEPIWQQIRGTLTSEISEGRYPAGARLPSEAALAARFGVNRHTVRRALSDMSDAGLVHARRGAGVFVTVTQMQYRLGQRTRFSQNLAEAGLSASRIGLRSETLRASTQEADALALPAKAEVHLIEGISLAEGVPIAHAVSVFPAAPLPGFLDAFEREQSVTEALKACGVSDYRRASTKLVAERATGPTARHLQLPEGAPILRAIAINTGPDNAPIEYGITRFAADRVELLVEASDFA